MPQLFNKSTFFIFLLTLFCGFLHFYKLNWGAPFYFHPDERNIANGITPLNFPNQMNPHFFAYGSLPMYTIYFTGVSINIISQLLTLRTLSDVGSTLSVSFSQAIILSRFYSALFATLLVPLLFYLGKKLKNETAGAIVAFLAVVSTGFIQFAHFGTFEMWLTFFSVWLFWLCLRTIERPKSRIYPLLMALVFGILISTKVSHLTLAPLPLAALAIRQFYRNKHWHRISGILKTLKTFIAFCIIAALVYIVTNPFAYLDMPSFLGSMKYESSVALGTLPVFYSSEFFNTLPVVFQFLYVYPFLLNPILAVLFIPTFFYIIWSGITKKNMFSLLLASCFLLLFLSQTFLYVKWTRYMMPTLPFIYIIIGLAFYDFLETLQKRQWLQYTLLTILLLPSIIFGMSYFITAFVKPDTRIAAAAFAGRYLQKDKPALSESFDIGITAFNDKFDSITLCNIYEVDHDEDICNGNTLERTIAESEYIIVPSQRILKIRLQKTGRYPKGHEFYQSLLDGRLGFQKIYETPCDIFCNITYLESPVFRFEETTSVFDRPTVFIFKRQG